MAETAVDAYAVTGTNAPATTPTQVAVVNDGTANRQVVAIGDGSGATGILALGQQLGSGSLPVVNASDAGDSIVTGQSAQSATVNNILTTTAGTAATDCIGFRSATVQINSTGTGGTYIFEGSNDNQNWSTVMVYGLVSTGPPITIAITASSGTVMWVVPLSFRYLRCRIVSTITGGTIQAITRFSQVVWTAHSINVGQGAAANLAATVSQSTAANLLTTVSQATAASLLATAYPAPPVNSTPIASGAIVTSTTTALSSISGLGIVLQLAVTAVSGTSPTMDVQVQESLDGGTTWRTIYQFPRVTSALATPLFSPPLQITGHNWQVVQTVGGSSPSFTRALSQDLTASLPQYQIRQIIDRTVAPNTLSSTTAALSSECTGTNAQLVVNMGAITTTAPAFQLQGSDDGGFTYYNIGSPLTSVASSTVQVTVPSINTEYLRAIVTTAGSGATLGYVLLKTF